MYETKNNRIKLKMKTFQLRLDTVRFDVQVMYVYLLRQVLVRIVELKLILKISNNFFIYITLKDCKNFVLWSLVTICTCLRMYILYKARDRTRDNKCIVYDILQRFFYRESDYCDIRVGGARK